jgi:hypothetical protein
LDIALMYLGKIWIICLIILYKAHNIISIFFFFGY